jgi:GNAT superfamily N-acetyltransferase
MVIEIGWFGRIYAQVANGSSKIIHPNRAADPIRINAYERALPFFQHHWTNSRADVWNLNLLSVDPNHQRQGHGRYLVAWGLEQAAREGIAVSVVSSAGNEQFYASCGFEAVVGNVTEGEGNPLSGTSGGAIMFRDRGRTMSSDSEGLESVMGDEESILGDEESFSEEGDQSFEESETSVSRGSHVERQN